MKMHSLRRLALATPLLGAATPVLASVPPNGTVPEPGTFSLFALAGAAVIALRLWKNR